MNEAMINSFDKLALLEDRWDHNQHYEQMILKEITNPDAVVLDIGCGTGEFAKRLSHQVKRVKGIDLSPKMIDQAKQRHAAANIHYEVLDFNDMKEEEKYDYIVSIATFHHLHLDMMLPKMKRMLKADGKLIVLDLYERQGVLDKLLDVIAKPLSLISKRVHNGDACVNQHEKELWEEHSHLDSFMTIGTLKTLYTRHFYNRFHFKRLVFWRYIMVFIK